MGNKQEKKERRSFYDKKFRTGRKLNKRKKKARSRKTKKFKL